MMLLYIFLSIITILFIINILIKRLLLPISLKFPKEDFELLMQGYEHGPNDEDKEERCYPGRSRRIIEPAEVFHGIVCCVTHFNVPDYGERS